MTYLAPGVSVGDFLPTTHQVEVHGILGGALSSTRRNVDELLGRELPPLDQQLDTKELPRIAEDCREGCCAGAVGPEMLA